MKIVFTYKNLPHAFLMCVVLCLFGVFFSSQAYAQQEELLDKTWYLYKLEMDGEEYEYYALDIQVGDEARIKIEMENDLEGIIRVDGCPGRGCDYYIELIEDESKFVLISNLCLASNFFCRDYGIDYDIINGYHSDFYGDGYYGVNYENFDSLINYSFETIDAIEYLIFTKENNDKFYYTAENLSTPDFEAFGLSVYPNPVDDRLNIRFLELPNNTSLEIYDVQGKLLENLVLSGLETQLDVSEYASGLYFIKIEDASGKQKVTKFVKQ